jgi:hypothetical protein
MKNLSDPDIIFDLFEDIRHEYISEGKEVPLGECGWCDRKDLLLMSYDGDFCKGNYCYECWLLAEECDEAIKNDRS